MRPQAMVHFEIIFFISLVPGIVMSVLMEEHDYMGLSSETGIITDIIAYLLYIAVALWASRLGSNFARWIIAILTILGMLMIAFTIPEIRRMGPVMVFSTPAYLFLQFAAIVFLFSSDARSWFRK